MPVHSIKNEAYGSYHWLMREVGRAVGRDKGLAPDPSLWDHSDERWIDSIVQSGYQQFCFPPPLPRTDNESEDEATEKDQRRRQPHTWSFLHRMETITFRANETTVLLPDDFVGHTGDPVLETGDGRLPIVPEDQLRALIAKNSNAGTPEYAAIRPKKTQEGQRYEMLLYPKNEAELTANFRYAITPPDLSDENPYPYGGRQHAATLLASCLDVAEDREKGEQGPAHARFMQRLAASIHLDKQSEPTGSTTWKSESEEAGNTLLSLTGEHMGFGQNPDAWTTLQREQVLQMVREGVTRFHQAAPVGRRKDAHQWTFLSPIHTINMESGKYQYDLPDDFGGFDKLGGSPLTYSAGDNVIYPEVDIVGEHHVRKLLQQTVQASGRPTKAGHGLKEGSSGYELIVWPVPDGSYALQCRYRAKPSQDMASIPGSDAHFLTILEAIRAAADVYLKRRNRPHEAIYQERLVASIAYDQQVRAPGKLGYDRAASSSPHGGPFYGNQRFGSEDSRGVAYNGEYFT